MQHFPQHTPLTFKEMLIYCLKLYPEMTAYYEGNQSWDKLGNKIESSNLTYRKNITETKPEIIIKEKGIWCRHYKLIDLKIEINIYEIDKNLKIYLKRMKGF